MKKHLIKWVLITIMLTSVVACGKKKQGEVPTEPQTEEAEEVYVDNPDKSDQGFVMVWNDEFEGDKLDLTKWSYQIGTGSSEGLTGWGNDELEYYTDRSANVDVKDGNLVITAIKEEERYNGSMFTSGRIRTFTNEGETLFATRFGRVEARMKLPEGEGLWPAFWLLPADKSIYGEWATSGEIDIMEARGRVPDKVGGAIHFGQDWPNNVCKNEEYTFPEGTDITDYHIYALEWEPGELRWYVDDECYYTMNNWFGKGENAAADYTYPAPFDVPFYILFNLAVGGTYDLGANPYSKEVEYPAQMFVDFVRVYHKKDGYPSLMDNKTVVTDNRDKESFALFTDLYSDGDFIVDKEFATMNTEAITDTGNGIIPNSKDWQFAVGNFGGMAKACVEDVDGTPYAKVDIATGGSQSYAVQVIQHLPLVQGYSYEVTFDAMASKERSFYVSPSGDGDNAWEKYGAYEAKVSPELSQYTYIFTMNSNTDPTARLEFNLGNDVGTIWIGNVKVTEMKAEGGIDNDMKKAPLADGNRIYNGTFDQGPQRMGFWYAEKCTAEIPDVVPAEDGSDDFRRMVQITAKEGARIYQNGIMLEGGTYDFNMDILGRIPADITVKLIGSGDTVYFEKVYKYATNDLLNFGTTFELPDSLKDDNAVLSIEFTDGTNIRVDNVSLKRKEE